MRTASYSFLSFVIIIVLEIFGTLDDLIKNIIFINLLQVHCGYMILVSKPREMLEIFLNPVSPVIRLILSSLRKYVKPLKYVIFKYLLLIE